MLWKNEPGKPEKATPWVIGIFGIVVFAIATYINYGDSWRSHTATDISASSAPSKSD